MRAYTRANTPEELRNRCHARPHACLHACRHAWTRAGIAPGPAATSDELLRGFWTGEDGLLASTTKRPDSNRKP
eukprot:2482040-Pyramimonas_sp.AAC.1